MVKASRSVVDSVSVMNSGSRVGLGTARVNQAEGRRAFLSRMLMPAGSTGACEGEEAERVSISSGLRSGK